MPKIVAVHGIGQQLRGSHTIHAEWLPALRDGLVRAGGVLPNPDDLACAFYGDLFQPKGTKAVGIPPFDASDVEDGEERELLELWWKEAARIETQVPSPDDQTKVRTPQIVQRALLALSHSRFFADIAERALIFDLKQVKRYFREPSLRSEIQQRVAQEVSDDTRVLIGHSLGSVVGYEVLCAHPEWPIRTLITLGSPLGIPNLIFDRLQPQPQTGSGVWPATVTRWTNIADGGDVVALKKQLQPLFGAALEDVLIYNGATAHDARPYLTTEETGRAIAVGLTR
jgi:hypothetical protein